MTFGELAEVIGITREDSSPATCQRFRDDDRVDRVDLACRAEQRSRKPSGRRGCWFDLADRLEDAIDRRVLRSASERASLLLNAVSEVDHTAAEDVLVDELKIGPRVGR